ncbi:helix-turn-helix transcriptional regulator [Nesterenkonia marinintestina]|uniref:helix-turn-helix transcriptional regulator n=1 Tax=Nesterenkonia marinintestina TaxID=2979865 RepID=UPI0021BE1A60|nr:helix-turn-helix domain-containing protein [Nesterenkonia sp. GX14115]
MELDELPPLPTERQVSAATGVPTGTLRYYRHRGHGGPASFKLTPRQVRYRREDVLKWIEQQYEASQAQRTA